VTKKSDQEKGLTPSLALQITILYYHDLSRFYLFFMF